MPLSPRCTIPILLIFALAESGWCQPAAWRVLPSATWPGASPGQKMVFDEARQKLVLVDGYRERTWEWDRAGWRGPVPIPATVGPRYLQAMAYDARRARIVVFGGMDGTGRVLGDTWEFDGTSWIQGPAAPAALTPRYGMAMCYSASRGRIVIFGGRAASGPRLAETWEYDGAGWTMGPVAPATLSGRVFAGLADDRVRGRLVLYGGEGSPANGGALGDTWELVGSSWIQAPAAPVEGTEVGLVFDAVRNAVVLFGRRDDGGASFNDTWLYDGAWRPGPAAPAGLAPRHATVLAYDPREGLVVAYGGTDETDLFGDTWKLGPGGWILADAGHPIVERWSNALIYDSARDRLVAFGGVNLWLLASTWEYDGAAWSAGGTSPAGLTARSAMAAAYDASRQKMVVFGGYAAATGPSAETWQYDGSWSPGPTAPAGMLARFGHAMAYDGSRQRVVLFGGTDGSARFNDTWEYDGTSWTAGGAAPGGLSARSYAAMGYDSGRGRCILFGGFDGATVLAETWEYDGTWSQGPVAPAALTPRSAAGMAYDASRARMVLMGGYDGASFLGDTWEYDGTGFTPGATFPELRSDHGLVYDSRRNRILTQGGSSSLTNNPPEIWELCTGCAPTGGSVVAGAGLGQPNPNRVRVHDAVGSPAGVDFLAYGAGQWGVNVATAEVNGNANMEIVTGPGPGAVYGPQVRGFLRDGTAMGKVNFYAYGTLKYGVDAAAGELDADGFQEILSGAGPGAVFGPHVRGWNVDGAAVAAISKVSFFAYGTLKYGVDPASGDVDRDGFAEILTGPGPGAAFAPQVRGFDYDGGSVSAIAKINFSAFATPQFGAQVAGGDVDGDGYGELLAAPGPGAGAGFPVELRGFDFDGLAIAPLPGCNRRVFATSYGGRLAAGEVLAAAREEIVVGAGPDPAADAYVKAHAYDGGTLHPITAQALPFALAYGASVAAGALGY